jgi:hypothetical protein
MKALGYCETFYMEWEKCVAKVYLKLAVICLYLSDIMRKVVLYVVLLILKEYWLGT